MKKKLSKINESYESAISPFLDARPPKKKRGRPKKVKSWCISAMEVICPSVEIKRSI